MTNNKFIGFHHFYLGIIILMAGFVLIWSNIPTWVMWSIFGIGFYIIYDDIYQHLRQRINPEYLSPLHKLYGFFYRQFKFLRKLNELFDKLFGAN